jgi:hypothetical protein
LELLRSARYSCWTQIASSFASSSLNNNN